MERLLLAIETSCDETAAAVFDLKPRLEQAGSLLRSEVVSSQVKAHEPYGGVVPELASREHIRNLPLVIEQALGLAHCSMDDVAVVAATRGPGLNGCLLVGLGYAKGLAFASGAALIPVNHLEAHLFASFLMERSLQPLFPCLALLVSGGHTSLVLWSSEAEFQTIASTRDDAAGEAFDKVASLLGFPYPGGPALAAAADEWGERPCGFSFPIGMPDDSSAFSFSGFKTAVLRTVQEVGSLTGGKRGEIAAAVQEGVTDALLKKIEDALAQHGVRSILLTGGVAANRRIRQRVQDCAESRGLRFCAPKPKWCTDNAAMVGAAGLAAYQREPEVYDNWSKSNTQFRLGPYAPFDLSAFPRWSLGEAINENS